MLRGLAWHLRILAQLVRIGIIRKAQFRVDFTFQVAMDCVWYAAHVGLFEVLYLHTPDIAGWSRDHFRVLLGYLFVSDAFMMIWLSQFWRMGIDLKDGRLDPVRVRPTATLFLYAFQSFSLEGCVNMAIALAYLLYAIERALGGLTPWVLLLAAWGMVLAFWARMLVMTLVSVAEFWLLGSDVGRFINDVLQSANDRPADIFGAKLRFVLLYLVPIGALSQVPASIVLGRESLSYGLLASLWLFALGLLVFALWNYSLRRYESAMG